MGMEASGAAQPILAQRPAHMPRSASDGTIASNQGEYNHHHHLLLQQHHITSPPPCISLS